MQQNPAMPYTDKTNTQYLTLLFWLRSFAGTAQLITILVTRFWFGIELDLQPVLFVLGAITLVNTLTGIQLWRFPERPVYNNQLFRQMLWDVGALTLLLYLCGGITNPFMNLFLLQVVIAAVILRPVYCVAFVVITVSAYLWLCIDFRGIPLLDHLRADPAFTLYSKGAMLGYLVTATLLGVVVVALVEKRRRQDAAIADVRQRQLSVEHITRTGLLAAGAAHELGTPLATMKVILADWQKFADHIDRQEMLADIPVLLDQLERCKKSVSALLRAAGNTRGEQTGVVTLGEFIADICTEWKTSHLVQLGMAPLPNALASLPIIADQTLVQALFILLDNAAEAGADDIRIAISFMHDMIVVDIRDNGPGVAASILHNLGNPYNSGKEGESRGMGLYLVRNISQMLGGSFDLSNHPEGGTLARLNLPLDRLEAP